MNTRFLRLVVLLAVGVASPVAAEDATQSAVERLLAGKFEWTSSGPLVSPAKREDPCYSVKDPSVVFHDGRWHVFMTIRSVKRTHQVEYISFADWKDAATAERHVLQLSDGYFCAPQVLYFTPHKKWYLVLQVNEPSRQPALQPAYSTTDNLADPTSWTKPALLYAEHPKNVSRWIDFWVICDQAQAHLFFTSLDGKMWRSQTKLAEFPAGWDLPRLALEGDIFEASHTYRLLGSQEKYLTLVEAQAEGKRYYKAYLADRLDGKWTPLAATREQPFAAPANVRFSGERWSDSFSHGELLRAGRDERLEVDPARLRFLYQGVSAADMQGKPYGQIPWRLGILEARP